jgi:hypothetical protein
LIPFFKLTRVKIWTSKPDGDQGWACFFLEKGFTVFVIDLPTCGRSNRIFPSNPEWKQLASDAHILTPELVEAELTAVGQAIPVRWDTAITHTQWPGVSTTTLPYTPVFCTNLRYRLAHGAMESSTTTWRQLYPFFSAATSDSRWAKKHSLLFSNKLAVRSSSEKGAERLSAG